MRLNALANLLGKAISSLAVLVAAPWQLSLLGPSAFGLVGLYAAWLSLFLLFDFGLGAAFTRELSRRVALRAPSEDLGTLVVTILRVFVVLGAVSALVLAAGAGWIVDRWLQVPSRDLETWRWAVRAMGLGIGLQVSLLAYQAALSALERQVPLNMILATGMVVRQFGVLPFLAWADAGAVTFFLWQAGGLALQVLACAIVLSRSLPAGAAGQRPRWRVARQLAGVAGPMFLLSLTATLLAQMDKLVLSAILPIDTLGRYTLAALAASAPNVFGVALQAALYPRLSREVATADVGAVGSLYQLSSLCISVVVVPTAIMGCVLAPQWLLLWTADASLVDNTVNAFRLLLIANLGLNLLLVPFTLQLAHADLRLALAYNTVAVPLVAAGMFWQGRVHGIVGIALVMALFYVGQVVAVVPYVHRRWLPPGATGFWMRHVILEPGLVAAVLTVATATALPVFAPSAGRLWSMLALGGALGTTIMAAAGASSPLRRVARAWLTSRRLVPSP